MRTALFGGSFDPPHLGHLAIARAAQQALSLDQVLFAPVGLQPLKPTGHSASFEDRVAMTRLAIANEPAFELSLVDAPSTASNTPNYTFDTLTRIRESSPNDQNDQNNQLFLLLGADSFCSLPRWHRAAELPFLASLIIASRPGLSLESQSPSDIAACLPKSITLRAAPDSSPNETIHYLLSNSAGNQADLYLLPNLHHDISATHLRNQIHHQSPNEAPLIAPSVLTYIHDHHLYEQ